MAEASIPVDQVDFMCPVCLALLKDPVAIPCGHSYCKICITDCWDQEDQKRVYSCPQCRQTFSPRPALATHVLLAEMLEKLKKTRLQTADCSSGSGDLECDICTGKKLKAVKCCLVCLNSYCQNHLQQHQRSFRGKKHKLTNATGRLRETICQKHEKQRILKETQVKYQERIQQREKELKELRADVESHKRSAQTAVEDSEKIFTELIRSIEKHRSEVMKMIRDQEKTAVSRAEEQLERLEQEINDLRRRDAELEQLSHTQDHIHFLLDLQSFSVPPESTEQPFTISSHLTFNHVKKSFSKLKEKLEDFRKEIEQISNRVTCSEINCLKEPKTRPEFLRYSRILTLDPDTVNKYIHLYEGNRAAKSTETVQSYPDHPDRFDVCRQVLCRESVCGRCYWEIDWSGNDGVDISVSYKSISRKGHGDECAFGFRDHSWSLICRPTSYSIWHNSQWNLIPVFPIISRIGVYVDHRAGTLSFYSVSDTMNLIHTFQTTFMQPLYPGFYVYKGSSVKLCDLTEEIMPVQTYF
ncbi:tripartite motif-containing protein 16-like protein [Carassius gibelio]|uniref:tripartite motif-containing protein 16-like protein n=1 Tax=Carassius gibelio TaxID=101364 RepID=UPI002277562B|nr:tripartite motif-containing protein 16-like protein [Carassius gibelio]